MKSIHRAPLAVLLLLMAATWIGCAGGNAEAFGAYKTFVKHLMTGRHDLAAELCATSSARNVVDALAREQNLAIGRGEDGVIHHAEYMLNSVEMEESGRVRLDVMVQMRMSPPGAASSFGTTVVDQRHIVVLQQRGDTWRVVEFEGRILPDWDTVLASL